MSVISRLLLVQPDPWIVEGLRFGFKREGIEVQATEPEDGGLEERMSAASPELVITGGRSQKEGLELLARVRKAIAAASPSTPILYLGNGVTREEALAEGAAEVLGQPAYVRDVVTLARLLARPSESDPGCLGGELNDHFGLYYLMRAISRAEKRGVLTLMRGLRRGELRFYDGEVTSAQVGTLHGLAALHQLLLWTEGRFLLRPENIIRRQQIPLAPADCLVDAERFLSEVKEVAGELSPSEVYEPLRDSRVDELPGEVQEILKLFDGSRTVADVVEDSPYRMFDTFHVARQLAELGCIKRTSAARDRHRARTALAIEEWLVGGMEDASGENGKESSITEVEWGHILPAQGSGEPESLSPVVPSTAAAGEIVQAREITPTSADRDYLAAGPSVQVDAPARERIEEVAGSEELNRMFPAEEQDSKEQERALPSEVDTEPTPQVSSEEVGEGRARDDFGENTASGEIDVPEPKKLQGEDSSGGSVQVAAQEPAAEATADEKDAPEEPTGRGEAIGAEPAAASGQGGPEQSPPAGSRTSSDSEEAAFTDDEQAFFARGSELALEPPDGPESFEDLDEGYEIPKTFWQRLLRNPNEEPRRGGRGKRTRSRRRRRK